MAGLLYQGDWLNHHTKMISEGFKVDHIIADVPSFEGRWLGLHGPQGHGTIRDLVSATCVAAEKMIDNADGTLTISCTGVAQEKLNEWVANQGDDGWELIPNSTYAMFRPYMRLTESNKHFWGRRDDWSFVQTFRKKGSSITLNRAGWPGSTEHSNAFDNFPMPSSMNDVEMSAFRSPVHKGEHEAKERQKWLGKHGISFEEIERVDGQKIVSQLGSGAHFTDGYIIQFSTDPADWYHITKRITQLVSLGLNTEIKEMFENNTHRGCRQLAGGNHKHVMLSMFQLAIHTKAGDKVLYPFCGMGSIGAACAIMGRDFVGVEMNKVRKDIAQNAYDELLLRRNIQNGVS